MGYFIGTVYLVMFWLLGTRLAEVVLTWYIRNKQYRKLWIYQGGFR